MFGKKDKGKDKNDKGGENNTKDNLNPWEQSDNNDTTQQQNSQQQQNQQQQQQNQQTAQQDNQKSMQSFFKQSGLYDNVNVNELFEAISNNDADKATAVLHTLLENAATVALMGARKMSQAEVQKAIESAKDDFTKTTRNDLAEQQMHERLPFTKKKEVSPMAKTVLDGFINNKGMSVDEAINATEQYFKSIGQEFGAPIDASNDRPGNSGFRRQPAANQQNDNNSDENDQDWVNFLTSGNQQFVENSQQQQSQKDTETGSE